MRGLGGLPAPGRITSNFLQPSAFATYRLQYFDKRCNVLIPRQPERCFYIMSSYIVLSRRYRPRKFCEVLGQDATVLTLKNAIKNRRTAHAYLFCGSRGTGKTTLARILAKALNCSQPDDDFEPCGTCPSCQEIASSSSIDVLEIDGASNRGIDDIRQINETVGYAPSSGKYKIYIIDEVHMLTKEAFNALLKTLEEPPKQVKFFFATTEPNKVPPTILSRCQRFNIRRISPENILMKMQLMLQDLNYRADEEALAMIAHASEGGLRDAESLLDQIISFTDGEITTKDVADILGITPKEVYRKLDTAARDGHFPAAFEIAHELFFSGKDANQFIEGLIEHYRNLLIIKIGDSNHQRTLFSENERAWLTASAGYYSTEQCLTILDLLIHEQAQMKHAVSQQIVLENLLLRLIRSMHRLSVDVLVKRLTELERKLESEKSSPSSTLAAISKPTPASSVPPPSPLPKQEVRTAPAPLAAGSKLKEGSSPASNTPKLPEATLLSLIEDPTPSAADLGLKKAPAAQAVPPPLQAEGASKTKALSSNKAEAFQKQNKRDTLLQFAAVELGGTLQKK